MVEHDRVRRRVQVLLEPLPRRHDVRQRGVLRPEEVAALAQGAREGDVRGDEQRVLRQVGQRYAAVPARGVAPVTGLSARLSSQGTARYGSSHAFRPSRHTSELPSSEQMYAPQTHFKGDMNLATPSSGRIAHLATCARSASQACHCSAAPIASATHSGCHSRAAHTAASSRGATSHRGMSRSGGTAPRRPP